MKVYVLEVLFDYDNKPRYWKGRRGITNRLYEAKFYVNAETITKLIVPLFNKYVRSFDKFNDTPYKKALNNAKTSIKEVTIEIKEEQ